ncbi:oxytocin receptor [Pelodiscus sinensis]|uniref:Oxytocin receptor n=1 Tax=Pelodiscus sinensis TaxID=13735 RepID=K7FHK3_PELSI|nr:oxytocin receptor [Pelodiscus sinensis]XP_014433936.1 oxytocin receptor [Pelodiscus sinensis]XP_014433937.1 oxytocin receptor [Pelodiscus sinensis]|eukprot:XP_006132871.1 oxytocin receptor [Pelodiscus sinensis]
MEKLSPEGNNLWTVNGSLINSSLSLENRTYGVNSTTDPLKRNEDMAKVEVTVLCFILFLALTGNLCVLLAIHTTRHKHSRMYYFMKHLSIADLVVAIFQVLPQLIWDITFRFYGPDFLCRLVKYLQVVGMFASTYMLLLMSLDRCLAICQPLRSLHRRSDRVSVLLTWLLCLLVSIPQIHIFSLRDVGNGVYDCWADFIQPWGAKAYITWITLTVYIIPVLMLSICYGLISFKIWQNVRLKTAHESNTSLPCSGAALSRVSSIKLISKAKIRTVKMTFIIVLAFIVCWTPFFFVQMWSVWDKNAPKEASPFIIAMLLASLNSCCNPWIYMLFTGHLFHDLMHRFLCCSTRYLKSRQSCDLSISKKSNSSTFVLSRKSSSQKSFTQPSTT